MELMWTNTDNLLPEDRTLLDEDFDKLGVVDASDQAYCIARTESALEADAHGSERKALHGNQQRDPPTADQYPVTHTPHTATANNAPIITTKGSIHYQIKKKKYMTDNPSSIETGYIDKQE